MIRPKKETFIGLFCSTILVLALFALYWHALTLSKHRAALVDLDQRVQSLHTLVYTRAALEKAPKGCYCTHEAQVGPGKIHIQKKVD